MAERYHFTVVPERLTGYRLTSTNMSSDLLQMYRSWRLVADEMRRKHPRFEKTVAAGTTYSITFFLERALEIRRLPLILLFSALLMPRDRVVAGTHTGGPAARLGLQSQQIQRYEASDYQAASFARLLEIARVLNLRVRDAAELVQK